MQKYSIVSDSALKKRDQSVHTEGQTQLVKTQRQMMALMTSKAGEDEVRQGTHRHSTHVSRDHVV